MPCAVVIDKDLRRCRRLADSVQACLRCQSEKWSVEACPTFQNSSFFYDIVLISVDHGLDDARRLREWDRRMAMLLVADSEEYVLKGYDLYAAAYLLRPVEPEMLERGLANALHRLNQNRAYIDLPTEGGTRREIVNNILFIEDEGVNSKVHAFDGEYRLLVPLNVLGLPQHFFLCDNRRVNWTHVHQITDKGLLVGNCCLPISRKTRRKLVNSLPEVIDVYNQL